MLSPDGIQQIALPKGLTIYNANGMRAANNGRRRDHVGREAEASSGAESETSEASTDAEGGLESNTEELQEQAAATEPASEEENLLPKRHE